jgi:hypothetical protein
MPLMALPTTVNIFRRRERWVTSSVGVDLHVYHQHLGRYLPVKPKDWLFLAVVVYHFAAMAKDFDTVQANYRRAKSDPSVPNILRLALAEGVFIQDLGWLF